MEEIILKTSKCLNKYDLIGAIESPALGQLQKQLIQKNDYSCLKGIDFSNVNSRNKRDNQF